MITLLFKFDFTSSFIVFLVTKTPRLKYAFYISTHSSTNHSTRNMSFLSSGTENTFGENQISSCRNNYGPFNHCSTPIGKSDYFISIYFPLRLGCTTFLYIYRYKSESTKVKGNFSICNNIVVDSIVYTLIPCAYGYIYVLFSYLHS